MAWPRKRIAWVVGSVIATIAVTLAVLNLMPAEQRIERKIERRYDTGSPEYFRSMGVLLGPPVLAGNRVEALQNGREIFPSMLAAIRGAQRTITFETYIYWSGEVGQDFADALSERARAGVRVHVLLDWVGSQKIEAQLLDAMREAGVQIHLYRPLSWYHIAPVAKGIAAAPKPAQEKISDIKEAILAGHAKVENGWMFFPKTGVYGTGYRNRALITWYGLGANRPQDAVYPTSEGPELLKKYSGANKYVMRFEKGQLPPAKGFWSITMYDDQYFFVPNPINRYTVSSRNKFKTNPDGSVDVYVQNESPGKDKEPNWLPAPKGGFVLMMRLYWPSESPPSILDGTWKPPEVQKTS